MTDIAADRLSLTLPDPAAEIKRRLRRIKPPKPMVLVFLVLSLMGIAQNVIELCLGRDLFAWFVPFSYTSTMVAIIAFAQYIFLALRAYKRDEDMFDRPGDPLLATAWVTLITSIVMGVAGLP